MRPEFFGTSPEEMAKTLAEVYLDIMPHVINKPKDYKKHVKAMKRMRDEVGDHPEKFIKEECLP